MLYIEDATNCSNCDGSPFTYTGTISTTAFDDVSLNYPNLGFSGKLSDDDVTVSFSSDADTDTDITVDDLYIGLISTYSGDDYTDNTWDGDSYVDGWLGLALDTTSETTEGYNFLTALYN